MRGESVSGARSIGMRTIWIVAVYALTLFSLCAADSPTPVGGVLLTNFNFRGGSLAEWVDQLNKTFKVDLYDVGEIDSDETRQVRVPKMRFSQISYWDLLRAYNTLSINGAEGLGKWVLMGTAEIPQVIAYQPPQNSRPLAKVKAFPVRFTAEKFDRFKATVMDAQDRLQDRRSKSGTLRWHPESGIVIAIGDEQYLDAVREIINALKEAPLAGPPS